MPSRTNTDFTFILFIDEAYDFSSQNLIGLISHETSHTNRTVGKYSGSFLPPKKIQGEILADVLAFFMTGPLFLHALCHWILYEVGTENSLIPTKYHPSLISRLLVLRSFIGDIWKNPHVFENISGYFLQFDSLFSELYSFEHKNIPKWNIVVQHEIDNFLKFKMDETILNKLNDIDKEEFEKLNTIYQLNKSLISGGK
jgi:hypothetical protein